MVVDNARTPAGERTRTVTCPFGQRSVCGPQQSPRRAAEFVYTPKITQWNKALFAINDANAECAALEGRIQRQREMRQGVRPQSGSAVEQARRELAKKRVARERRDDRRVAKNERAEAADFHKLALELQLEANAELQLKTATTALRHVEGAHFQQKEAARAQMLADSLEGRSALMGELQWQRAVDNALVKLATTREDDAAMRASAKRRYAAMLRSERREEVERLRLNGLAPSGRPVRPASAGDRPAGEPHLGPRGHAARRLAGEVATRNAQARRMRTQLHIRQMQEDEWRNGRSVDRNVEGLRTQAWQYKLDVTRASTPRPSTPLEPPSAAAARAAAVAQDADDDDVDDDDDEDMPSARPIVRPSSARTRRSLNGEDLEARTSRPFSAHNRPKPPAMSIAQRDSGTRMAHHLGVA